MRVSSIRWGVIFIGIGLLFLAINLELLDTLVFPRLFSLWPVLLIAIGVEIIFRRTRFYFLAFLSPLIIAAAFIAAATATGDWGWKADEFWSRWVWRATEKKVDIVEIPADSAICALKLDLQCGPSDVSFEPTRDLMFKSTTEYYRRSPWVEHSATESTESIQYTNREKVRLALFGFNVTAARSEFQIANFLPLKVDITALDDEPDFDFSGLLLRDLNLDIRSNRAIVRLGDHADSIDITISGETSNLDIVLPGDLGLAISGDTPGLNALLKGSEMSPGAETYFSRDYGQAQHKVFLVLNANIKTFMIRRN
ncbi:MAG TPA: hypothetical protein DEO84_00925 [candidate division Zixibacteria bacterium]|nr:hypothetical protein [candidate division Zixibacteria bacterium]